MTSFPFRSALASLLLAVSGSVAALLPSPSLALERLRMTLPLVETAVTLELGQAQTAQQLLKANPDLAELDQVGEGAVTRVLEQMLTASLPKQSVGFVRESAGDPLFEQALLAATQLRDWDLPESVDSVLVAHAKELKKTPERFELRLRVRLDTAQLPKPLQMNALTNRDWNLSSDWVVPKLKVDTSAAPPQGTGRPE